MPESPLEVQVCTTDSHTQGSQGDEADVLPESDSMEGCHIIQFFLPSHLNWTKFGQSVVFRRQRQNVPGLQSSTQYFFYALQMALLF